MWNSLGATALFTLLLLTWWGVLTEGGKETKFNRTGPIGVGCITVVYIVLLFFHYR